MRRLRPIEPDERQRYWRRRANRRVRKARLRRTALRGAAVLAANALVAGVLLYAASAIIQRVVGSDEFRVAGIVIDGPRRADPRALRAALDRFVGANIIELDLREVEATVERDPWVREAAVRRVLPHTLHVTVIEREPVAAALIDDEIFLVDGTGHVIGRVGVTGGGDLPVLTGLGGRARDDLARELRDGVQLVARLRDTEPELVDDASELDLARRDRVTVRTRQQGPLLYLDPQRVERNVAEYLALREVLHERAGATDYVDLRWDGRIAVHPTTETTKEIK